MSETISLRSLYVGATRGRHANQLLVVTDTVSDLPEARDVLERVLTNDRVDIPAIVQRQRLALDARPSRHRNGTDPAARGAGSEAPQADLADVAGARDRLTAAEQRWAAAHVALADARRRAQPALDAHQAAEDALRVAEADHARCDEESRRSRPWQRRRVAAARAASAEAVRTAHTEVQARWHEAQPLAKDVTRHLHDLDVAKQEIRFSQIEARPERRAAKQLDRSSKALESGRAIDGIGW